MAATAVVYQHEKIYAHIEAINAYMTLAMEIFEYVGNHEMEDIRKNILHHVRSIEGLLTGA